MSAQGGARRTLLLAAVGGVILVGGAAAIYLWGTRISPAAVQAKAYRIGLPGRHGLTLSKDSEAAREIDRRAAPLAERIRNKSGQSLQRRPCTMSGVWFYSIAGQSRLRSSERLGHAKRS